mmetsp:Transcript_120876/g.386967  ORF Transcript_120876/g.386967 Transcript_120876/m.386967 type:complete len:306 (-) Transcript_120876:216-1133(-)
MLKTLVLFHSPVISAAVCMKMSVVNAGILKEYQRPNASDQLQVVSQLGKPTAFKPSGCADHTPGAVQYSVLSQSCSNKSPKEPRARTVSLFWEGALPSAPLPWPNMYTVSPSPRLSAKKTDENQVKSVEPTSYVVYCHWWGSSTRATSLDTITEVPTTFMKPLMRVASNNTELPSLDAIPATGHSSSSSSFFSAGGSKKLTIAPASSRCQKNCGRPVHRSSMHSTSAKVLCGMWIPSNTRDWSFRSYFVMKVSAKIHNARRPVAPPPITTETSESPPSQPASPGPGKTSNCTCRSSAGLPCVDTL